MVSRRRKAASAVSCASTPFRAHAALAALYIFSGPNIHLEQRIAALKAHAAARLKCARRRGASPWLPEHFKRAPCARVRAGPCVPRCTEGTAGKVEQGHEKIRTLEAIDQIMVLTARAGKVEQSREGAEAQRGGRG